MSARPALSPSEALLALIGAIFLLLALSPAARPLLPYSAGWVQAAALALPVLFVARRAGASARSLGLRTPSLRASFGGLLLGASFWIVHATAFAPLLEASGLDPGHRAAEIASDPSISLGVAIALLAILPAASEELLYRGALARALRPALGLVGAAALQAALFSLLHLSPARVLPLFLFGLLLGLIALRADSIVPSALAHALHNAAAIALAFGAGAPLAEALETSGPLFAAAGVAGAGGGLWLAVGGPPDSPRPGSERSRPPPPPR